mgnify:CR=1 FL=1
MNTITVTAHCDPNSLARQLQHDPTLGIEAINLCREWVSEYLPGMPPKDKCPPELLGFRNRMEAVVARADKVGLTTE